MHKLYAFAYFKQIIQHQNSKVWGGAMAPCPPPSGSAPATMLLTNIIAQNYLLILLLLRIAQLHAMHRLVFYHFFIALYELTTNN